MSNSKTIELFIDGIEGDFARLLLLDNCAIDFPAALLPEGAKEGMALTMTLSLEGKDYHDEIEELLKSLGGDCGDDGDDDDDM